MTATFVNILTDLINVVKTSHVKLDSLQNSIETLRQEFNEVKTASDYSLAKLKQVEAGMEGLDIPAYTDAILELAQNVKIVLETPTANKNESTLEKDTPIDITEDTDLDTVTKVPQVEDNPGVLIITDMYLTRDHVKYMEKQLGLGQASIIKVESPWNRQGLEELKCNLDIDISSYALVMFNFSTMNITDYSYNTVNKFVMLANQIAVRNRVKVVISSLPPRYVGQWDNMQYTEHYDVNDYIIDSLIEHQVDRDRVFLAEQTRLSCPPGRVRGSRYTETGALSDQGTYLYLKNTLAAVKLPAKTRSEHSTSIRGASQVWGVERSGKLSDKKLLKLLKNLLKCE